MRGWGGAIVLITHDRWFHRILIAGAAVDGDVDGREDEGQEEEGELRRGKTYLVDKGRVKIMESGMEGYERLVVRRMKKAEAARAA